MRLYITYFSILALSGVLSGCYPDESINVPVTTHDVNLTSEIDQYIEENFIKKYGVAVRYRFVDRYVDPTTRVTPPTLEAVRPMLDIIEDFWIQPFMNIENGDQFFREHVPGEVILLGGVIFNGDGSIKLGVADAFARITFTDVNRVDRNDEDWLALTLNTVYHEFAHIHHFRHDFPPGFERISPEGYSSPGGWLNVREEEALRRGFVSPYATSQVADDYAETVSRYMSEKDFESEFMELEEDCDTPECEARNEGRLKIREKIAAIAQHYQTSVGVDLHQMRAAVQTILAQQ
ncbi:MAG: putative zinc-binding metallopeptidase [Cyclobacteriaceae bacterium]